MAIVGMQFVVTVGVEVDDPDNWEPNDEATKAIEEQLKYSVTSRKAQLNEALGDGVIGDILATFEDVTV